MSWQQFVSELGYEPTHETFFDLRTSKIRYVILLRHGGKLVFANDYHDEGVAA